MKRTTIPVAPDVRVTVKCNSELSVEGNESPVLVVIVDQGDCLRMKEDEGVYRIVSDSDCRILLPNSAILTVEKTGDDCRICEIKGRVVVGKIGADLRLDNVGGASIESVGADCSIHGSTGAIEVARIGDTLSAVEIQSILAASVGEDVFISQAHGKIEVAAGDDVNIDCSEAEVPEIKARAGSNIKLILPKSANCQLKLTSSGEDIVLHAGGQDAEIEEQELSMPIGEGGPVVALTAGDGIEVTDQKARDWEDGDGWDGNHWKDFGFEISKKVKDGLRGVEGSVEQALRQAGVAASQAGREVDRALRDLDDFGFKAGKSRKVVGFSMGEESKPVTPEKKGPSDEERMLVLKMLQEKKITVEEAEKLLNALDS